MKRYVVGVLIILGCVFIGNVSDVRAEQGKIKSPSVVSQHIKYPPLAQDEGMEGKVLVRVVIETDGTVSHVSVVQSSGFTILDEAAIDSVKQWMFTPAASDGKPIKSVSIMPIFYKLQEQDAVEQAILAIRQQQFERAVRIMSNQLQHEKSSRKYSIRAWAYNELGELDKAKADADVAIALDEENALAYQIKGCVLDSEGLLEEAIIHYTRVLALQPENERAYNNRGYSYMKQEKHLMAIIDFKKAIYMNPAYADPYSNLGTVYIRQGRSHEAKTMFQQYLSLAPRGEKAKIAYAQSMLKQLEE